MAPQEQKSLRVRQGSEKILLAALIALILASMGGTVVLGSAFAARSLQIASAASAAKGTSPCEKKYQQCIKDKKQKDKSKCERDFQNCHKKCKPSQKGGKITCPKDPDCQLDCTEASSSKTGLISCCQSGPKHKNSCPDKVDGKCNPKPGKMPKGMGKQPQKQGQGGQGDEKGMPQIPMPPPPSPKSPPPPPQGDQKKTTRCDQTGKCFECDQQGKCTPLSQDASAGNYEIR